MPRKQIVAKIYDTNGNIADIIENFSFSVFQYYLYGGSGELMIQVPRKFDDFGEGTTVGLNYKIEIYISDTENPNGLIIYSGLIDVLNPSISQTESVTFRCSGYISQMALDKLEQGTNQTSFVFKNQDPSEMMKDVVDAFRAVNSQAEINYTASSVQLSGKSESISFNPITPLDALREIGKLFDADWVWYIDASNILNVKQISSTSDHSFILGKDVTRLSFDKNIRDLRNGLLFFNGLDEDNPESIYKLYSDSTSITTYGRRFDLKRDGRFKASTGSADEYGTRFVDTYKDPINTVTLSVVDSNLAGGYDIESIQVGDTCRILNIAETNGLSNNMLITSITYNADSVDLVLTDVIKYVNREIAKNRENIFINQFGEETPDEYTT